MTNEVKNILDKVFSIEEQDVGTFADVLLSRGSVASEAKDDIEKIKSGSPDKVQAPDLKLSKNGYIEMLHGWDKRDYVWHIKPWHPKKQYRVTLKRVIYTIASTMNETIPEYITVDMFMPNQQWSIPELTFKAKDLLDVWSIKDSDIAALNEKLFTVLNALV